MGDQRSALSATCLRRRLSALCNCIYTIPRTSCSSCTATQQVSWYSLSSSVSNINCIDIQVFHSVRTPSHSQVHVVLGLHSMDHIQQPLFPAVLGITFLGLNQATTLPRGPRDYIPGVESSNIVFKFQANVYPSSLRASSFYLQQCYLTNGAPTGYHNAWYWTLMRTFSKYRYLQSF